MTDALNRIRTQIIWDRLLAVVEEQAQTLVRTAFSTSTRKLATCLPASLISGGVWWLRP